MKQLTTKEHLLHFMTSGYMRLSKYDLKFIQNIQGLVHNKQSITSNQVSLFEKLVEKYKRQLDKHNLTIEVISKMPWEAEVKDSDPYYTEAFVSILDRTIYFRAPYNKHFILEFRNNTGNPFKWDKEDKRYEAAYSAFALKTIVTSASKHYSSINYCAITTDLLASVAQYKDATVWSPTLVNVNGNFIIAGTNEPLHNAIATMELNSDLLTINTLAEYGVSIHPDIINGDPKRKFASSYSPSIDYTEIDSYIPWLKELGCDYAFIETSGMDITYRKILTLKLTNAGIVTKERSTRGSTSQSVMTDNQFTPKFPIHIEFSSFAPTKSGPAPRKVIRMTNSTPINIK